MPPSMYVNSHFYFSKYGDEFNAFSNDYIDWIWLEINIATRHEFRRKLSLQVFGEILPFAETFGIKKGGWPAMAKKEEEVVLEMEPARAGPTLTGRDERETEAPGRMITLLSVW